MTRWSKPTTSPSRCRLTTCQLSPSALAARSTTSCTSSMRRSTLATGMRWQSRRPSRNSTTLGSAPSRSTGQMRMARFTSIIRTSRALSGTSYLASTASPTPIRLTIQAMLTSRSNFHRRQSPALMMSSTPTTPALRSCTPARTTIFSSSSTLGFFRERRRRCYPRLSKKRRTGSRRLTLISIRTSS